MRANLKGATTLPQVLVNPWLPAQAIQAIATSRLRDLVESARTQVPYYQARFRESGVAPEDIQSVADIARLPILDKSALRDNAEAMISSVADRRRLQKRSSSGSSGIPVNVYFDPIGELPRRLQELRFLSAHGFRPWYTQLIFDALMHQTGKRYWLQRLGIWRREPFPSWLDTREAITQLNRLEPEIIHGVLTELKMLALALDSSGGLTFRPKLVVTKGELLDNTTRKLIESSFGAPVADYYATEEVGIIAWECPTRSGYHVDQDLVLVEVLDEQNRPMPAGQSGEILVTNLYQRVMPIIRFRTGDLGALSPTPCSCGRNLPLLRGLHGRKLDCILTPSGELHEPFRLISAVELVPHVRQYRIAQNSIDALLVEIVWDHDAGDAKQTSSKRLIDAVRVVLGTPQMRVDVVEVPSFPRPYAKKFQVVKGLPPDALREARERPGFRIRMSGG